MHRATIKHGFIGLGRICSLLEKDSLREKPCTHAGAVAVQPHSIIHCGCDLQLKKRKQFQSDWNCSKLYSDAEEMIFNEPIDILHIATPASSHRSLLKIALSKQIPVIICEKPLSVSLKEAKKMVSMTTKSTSRLLINHERRYSLDYQIAKQWIESEKLGPLCSVEATLLGGGGGNAQSLLFDDGTHLIDIIRFLTACNFYNINKSGDFTQSQSCYIHSQLIGINKPSIPCQIQIGSGRDHFEFFLTLYCRSGKLTIGNGIFDIFQSKPSPYYKGFYSLIKSEQPPIEKTGYFTNMLMDAIQCYFNQDRVPISQCKDGYEAMKVIFS